MRTSIQTNCFWATSEKDAVLWLRPLLKAGLTCLDVSDDACHLCSVVCKQLIDRFPDVLTPRQVYGIE